LDSSQKKWRIAVVSLLRKMDAQHGLDGIYRHAEQLPEICIQRFDAEAHDFRREVLTPLRAWQPHGVMVRMGDQGRLRQLRALFPSRPFVSMVVALPDIANTVVVGDVMDSMTKARDYFRHCGLSHIAMFCISSERLMVNTTSSFREAVPAGLELVCPLEVIDAHTPEGKKRQREIMSDGLRKLPKPVGIMTRETQAGPFLLDWCHELGLRVPEEVQIIGMDEEDLCLGCEPRLTSYVPPNRRIGETALKTMLHLLREK
jgi:DNA-binding LacI/PurR family transcriptional regulator